MQYQLKFKNSIFAKFIENILKAHRLYPINSTERIAIGHRLTHLVDFYDVLDSTLLLFFGLFNRILLSRECQRRNGSNLVSNGAFP